MLFLILPLTVSHLHLFVWSGLLHFDSPEAIKIRHKCQEVSVQHRHHRSSAGEMIPTSSTLVTEQLWSFLKNVDSLGVPLLSFKKGVWLMGSEQPPIGTCHHIGWTQDSCSVYSDHTALSTAWYQAWQQIDKDPSGAQSMNFKKSLRR